MSLINTKSHCWGPCTVDISLLSDARNVEQRVLRAHHEIGEASFFLDIIGKITRQIVGLYAETKLDKVVYNHEQIGIERQDIAKGPQFW